MDKADAAPEADAAFGWEFRIRTRMRTAVPARELAFGTGCGLRLRSSDDVS